ncbi:MAG: hypothetical protein ACR2MP_02620 [Streptosporangiaceae bacterium]
MAKELVSLEVKGAWIDDHLLVPAGAGAGKQEAEATMNRVWRTSPGMWQGQVKPP